MKVIIEIDLHQTTWKRAELIDIKSLKKYTKIIVTTVLKNRKLRFKEFTISMVFTTDKKIQQLNKEHRGKDSPTNVLSFQYVEDNIIQKAEKYQNEELYIGELIFGYETILKEAQEKAYPFECTSEIFQNHLTHLIIHGTLHLLGYDHKDDKEAEIMEELEIEILKGFGIENPYL